ncbi:MAG: HEAT repeat domain-containing protein [Candidatus Dormibacteraceae bacterium]
MAEPYRVGQVVVAALAQAGPGLTVQWRITEPFRRAGLTEELINSLVSEDSATRAAAARLCGSLRLPQSVAWIEDLVRDDNPKVHESAIRALGLLGGRRAVEALMGAADRIPTHRLAIALSMAASDLDIEALMRQPESEKAAIVTVLACGLRRDALRVPPLLGIAHDRRWPKRVRVAACKSLGMIGEATASEGLRVLVEREPDADVKKAAVQAQKRLHPAAAAVRPA